MSLLQTLKGTLKSVQEDVSEGFKSFTTAVDKPAEPQPRIRHIPQAKLINYEAGGELLHKHEGIWKQLYEYSEQTGKRAQNIDVGIAKLYTYCEGQSEILVRLHKETADLPVLLNQLQEITDSLAHVEEACDKVEGILVQLENVCEEQEYMRNQTSHHKQLAVYKMKKEHELETYKVHLARKHASKMEEITKKREYLLHERQAAFEEQFSQDVDYFKKHGNTGRQPTTPEMEKKLDLSDMKIEEDENALDEFLESSADNIPEAGDDVKQSPDSEVPTDSEETTVVIAPDITSPVETDDKSVTMVTKESVLDSNSEAMASQEAAGTDSNTVNSEIQADPNDESTPS